ncbi:MFS transporter [Actinophytocola sp.]|uniref:MFS transporter n=1 Tax=Actinophytocola sp. TaxID=1872138 RepID=UPI002D7F48E0|nr:MFS transporter [Actinophytocola sp.]HET9143404.1 MFS transporter [Actinophytocola sp.]HEU5110379.1 MFS transporter [Micromonosporaceae bacterium]
MQLYRRMLALPGIRSLTILIFFARIPLAASAMILTLHVAIELGRGYGAAGLVGAAVTVGAAVAAPVMGRVVDRYGLRRMLMITVVGETLFWLTARFLPYPLLLVAGFAGGFFILPAMGIGRQAIAALVPAELRRTAYSLDSISTELSFMVGPALAVLLVTQLSTTAALTAMAIGIAAVGTALFLVNPAVRSAKEKAEDDGVRPPRRSWLTPRLIAVLLIGAGAVFVLAGSEVTVVAQLRGQGDVAWTGLVVGMWSAASAIGGLVYGGLHRSFSQVGLMALLGALTIPVGLVHGDWWLLALALLPAGLLCAPTIAATGEEVSRLAPVAVRGEATGMQSTGFTLGAATGAPVVGFVVDHSSPAWGFAVAGLGGILVAAAAVVLIARSSSRHPDQPAQPQPASASAIS